MTMYFFYPIQQSAQQIYHTALPLLPLSSSLCQMNQDSTPRTRTHITGFLGAPSDWGLLLTTISVGSRRPTAIATFAEKIAIACEDVMNIYNAVTFALEKSLRIPQSVMRIQGSGDGSILYSTHSHSVALWDIQTGGLTDTFHTQSAIGDTVVSQTDGHIACRLSDGSVVFRNGRTKNEDSFQGDQPAVTICWFSLAELAVGTTNSIHIINIDTRTTSRIKCIHDTAWGMVVLSGDELMVGTSKQEAAGEQELCFLIRRITHKLQRKWELQDEKRCQPSFRERLTSPMCVGENAVFITPPNGVQVLDIKNRRWTKPPLLEKAKSLATSLDRNLVVQAEDSVQIFSFDVLTSNPSGKDGQLSHTYPLGEKYAVCLRIDRQLTILELETLRILRPGVDTLLLKPSPTKPPAPEHEPCCRGLVAEFGVSTVSVLQKLSCDFVSFDGSACC